MAANHVPYQPYADNLQPAGGNPHAYENINANPNAFGAGIGQAVEHAGNQFEELAVKKAQMDNDLYSSDQLMSGVNEMTNSLGRYSQLEGNAAVLGFENFKSEIHGIAQKYIDAAPNLQAKTDLARVMRGQADRFTEWGMRRQDSQREVWHKKERVDFTNQQIGLAGLAINQRDADGVPIQTEQAIETAAQNWRENMRASGSDLGPDGKVDTAVVASEVAKGAYGPAYENLIKDQINRGDIPTAALLFNRNAPKMDPLSRLRAESALRPKIEEYNIQAIGEPKVQKLIGGGETTESPPADTQKKLLKLREFQPSDLPQDQQPQFNRGPHPNQGQAEIGIEAARKQGIEPTFNQGHYLGLRGGLSTITTNSGAKITVASETLPQWQGFLNDLEARGYYIDPKQSGGYNNRSQLGGYPSQHAIGNAVDINWTNNPQGSAKNDLPRDIGKLADKWGISWGGYIQHPSSDAMHFEVSRRVDVSKIRPENNDVQQAVNDVSGRRGFKPGVLSSLINTESVWNTRDNSGKYNGLTQIGRDTFDEAGGRLAGLTYDQYVKAGAPDQIRAYDAWLQHYNFDDKMRRNGIDFANLPANKQAAVLQAFQFGPNDERWMKAAGSGNWDQPVTNTKQAAFLGSTSLNDMAAYYGGTAKVSAQTAPANRSFVAYAGYPTGTATDASFAGAPNQTQPALTDDDLKGETQQETDIYKEAAKETEGNPKLQHGVLQYIRKRLNDFRATHQTDVNTLNQTVPNAIELAMRGKDTQINEPLIWALEPKKAQKWIEEFHVAQAGGKLVREAQWATPQRLDQIEAELNSGRGAAATDLRIARGAPLRGPGTVGADPDSDLGADHVKLRERIAAEFKKKRDEREKALQDDSAGYVKNAPYLAPYQIAVAGALANAKANPNDQRAVDLYQAAWNRYAAASVNYQKTLGVPEDDTHVLDRKSAQAQVHDIMRFGSDPKSMMEGLEKQYGESWKDISQDLVTLGGLPANMQMLRLLDDKDGEDLSHFLKMAASTKPEKGSGEGKALTPDAFARTVITPEAFEGQTSIKHLVNSDLNVKLMDQAYERMGYKAPFIRDLHSSIENLAYAKAMKPGANYSTATREAINAFTKKYKFLDATEASAMIPQDRFNDVRANMNDTLLNLKAEDLIPPRIFREHTTQMHVPYNEKGEHVPIEQGRWVGGRSVENWVRDIKAAPAWMNAPDGKPELWLTDANITLGYPRPVMGKDGKPIAVKFSEPARNPVPVGARPASAFGRFEGTYNTYSGNRPAPSAPTMEAEEGPVIPPVRVPNPFVKKGT